MAKDSKLNIRINSSLKEAVEKILMQLGLTTSEAVTALFYQIKMQRGLPFSIHIPNEKTLKAIEETEKGEGLTEYENVGNMVKDSKNR